MTRLTAFTVVLLNTVMNSFGKAVSHHIADKLCSASFSHCKGINRTARNLVRDKGN